MTMHFRDRPEVVQEGSMILVPRGLEHRPVAEEEAWIVLFEPQATDHTGGVDSLHRRTTLQRVNLVTLNAINLRWTLWSSGCSRCASNDQMNASKLGRSTRCPSKLDV